MNNLTVPTQDLIPALPKSGMPVTIITGFLGSGKTTLLNQILQNRQELKVAVLVNEFGDINIDSQLLVSFDEDMVELSNGCICCTINDRLIDAVYRVLEREDRIDYLVIETTGVADPLPIALTFLSPELRDLTRLDSVLTVVDASEFTPEHFASDAALNQVAYGDIILLNKTDLVSEEKVNELENYIRTVKDKARILRSQYGGVPLPLILDVELLQPDIYLTDSKLSHHPPNHLANDGFVSISFQSNRPFSINQFEFFLHEQMPNDVFRAKGILWFKGSERCHIFQLSGKRFELNDSAWQRQPSNQLVLIGRSLNALQLQQMLNNCLTQ